MTAASKGDLGTVRYLLSRGNVNPMTKNDHGETAYDAAALHLASSVCEELERAERQWWERPSNAGKVNFLKGMG